MTLFGQPEQLVGAGWTKVKIPRRGCPQHRRKQQNAPRERSGLSQARFAALLGVSVRTLQEWEQGRRQPSGAARTLLKVAERYPEILREVAEA